eukprot:COSAG05_NODE_255_length_12816_cov_13.781631_12_plen_65_part_00
MNMESMGNACGTGTMNYTECEKTCKTKLHPIPPSECGAPSGGTNDTCVNGAKPKYHLLARLTIS